MSKLFNGVNWATWAQTGAAVVIALAGVWWMIDGRLDTVEAWQQTRDAEHRLQDKHREDFIASTKAQLETMRQGFGTFGKELSNVRREFTAAQMKLTEQYHAVQADLAEIKADVKHLRGPS